MAEELDALPGRPRAGRPPTVTEEHLAAPEARLDAGGRIRTTPQLVARFEDTHGVQVHPDHLGRSPHVRRAG